MTPICEAVWSQRSNKFARRHLIPGKTVPNFLCTCSVASAGEWPLQHVHRSSRLSSPESEIKGRVDGQLEQAALRLGDGKIAYLCDSLSLLVFRPRRLQTSVWLDLKSCIDVIVTWWRHCFLIMFITLLLFVNYQIWSDTSRWSRGPGIWCLRNVMRMPGNSGTSTAEITPYWRRSMAWCDIDVYETSENNAILISEIT